MTKAGAMLKDVNVMSHCIRFDDMRLIPSFGHAQAGLQAEASSSWATN